MARLASQAKGGFYSAAPDAVAAVLSRLRPPLIGECPVLDPCCGQSMALLQLVQGLEETHAKMAADGTELFGPGIVKPTALNVLAYGIELSEDRAAIAAALLDEDKALCPCDFFRCQVSYNSFSLVWSNPPFDGDSDGRVELQFAKRAIGLLVDGGIMAFVSPESVAESYEAVSWFEERLEQISVVPFPEHVRRFGEVVVLGRKRKQSVPVPWSARREWMKRMIAREYTYDLPAGVQPRVWKKTEPTDAELRRLTKGSLLRFMLDKPADDLGAKRPRPPMSLGTGHRALVLASGFLDGAIFPPGEEPHVVRGSCSKETYVSACETTEDENGTTTKTTLSEKPRLVVRVLDHRGESTTLE